MSPTENRLDNSWSDSPLQPKRLSPPSSVSRVSLCNYGTTGVTGNNTSYQGLDTTGVHLGIGPTRAMSISDLSAYRDHEIDPPPAGESRGTAAQRDTVALEAQVEAIALLQVSQVPRRALLPR